MTEDDPRAGLDYAVYRLRQSLADCWMALSREAVNGSFDDAPADMIDALKAVRSGLERVEAAIDKHNRREAT